MAKKTSLSHGSPLDVPTSAPDLPADLAKQLTVHIAKQPKPSEKPATTTPNEKQPADGAVQSSSIVADQVVADSEDPILDNPQTDEAVDEILKEESDTVLDAEDGQADQDDVNDEPETPKKRGFWHRRWLRNIVLLLIFAGIAATAAIPTSRYYVLNKAGVRSSMSLRVIDQSTQLPLKNVHVTLDNQNVATDDKGVARITHLTLGPHNLSIARIAFATIAQKVTLGWGSNPLGDFTLNPTGVKYIIKPADYVSGKPIAGAHATSGGADAVADGNGVITLTLDSDPGNDIAVDVSASGYLATHITINAATTKATQVTLVPSTKDIYVSKQSGTYDVMSSYVDGTGSSTLLRGTGTENNNISLAVDNSGGMAALVSTRDNQRDAAGDLLSTLTLIDTAQGTATTIDHAEHVQLVDWIGTSLIFQETTEGTGANKYHVVAYDYSTSRRYDLSSAAQFNNVLSMQGQVYYAVSSSDPAAQAIYYRINTDGTGRQVILNKEVWSVFRTDYNTLDLQTPDGWYNYSPKGTPQQITTPSTTPNYAFVSGAGSQSLWIGNENGQSTLYVHDANANKDTKIAAQDGLSYPVRWLNDTTISYRVSSGGESADYVVSTQGGAPKKIADVTNTYAYNN
ncbi:MAG: hypothetical protein ACQR33_06400 [Candidatus Saccharibacteria bacterium]